ncbi:MAG: hypothetical protein ACE5EU_14330 [Paracoccaceae bacterium]
MKLELVCETDKVNQALSLIRDNGRTGQKNAGWVYVSEIESVYPIDDGSAS